MGVGVASVGTGPGSVVVGVVSTSIVGVAKVGACASSPAKKVATINSPTVSKPTKINTDYRNAWHNMISACTMENDKKGMMAAFKQSLKYGFRPGSIRLLVEGLLKTGWANDH